MNGYYDYNMRRSLPQELERQAIAHQAREYWNMKRRIHQMRAEQNSWRMAA